MPGVLGQRRRQRQEGRREFKSQTKQWVAWKGVNLTDSRVAIDDDELYWMENAFTIGKGAIQILNGPGAAIATIAAGITSVWGVVLNGTPILVTVNSDGSMSQVTTGGVVTQICAAGVMATDAVVTMWRGSPVLIVSNTKGYAQWDGATFTLVDATKTGVSIAVFEGRVWIASARTITFTAPNTNNDFTAANGAGTTVLTDEAFEGNIVALVSAIEQLWVVGQVAIDTISNVTATGAGPVVTTFSVTNIVTDLGSNALASVRGYFRALALMAPYGVWALSGVTPQKLSDKLDGLFTSLTLGSAPAAVGVVKNKLCLFYLVTYTGTNAYAQEVASSQASVTMLLGFTEGKWFFASQGTALRWITSVPVNGVSTVYAADATHLFQCFGASDATAVAYKVSSKLHDYGRWDAWKALMKLGMIVQGQAAIAPTLTADTEMSSTPVTLTTSNTYTLRNAAGGVLQLINAGSQNLNLVGQGLVMSDADAPTGGHFLGWTIKGSDPIFQIVSASMEYVITREHAVGQN